MECLDDNVATEFVTGMLAKPAAARVEGHLASCRDCRALVAALAGDSGDDSDLATRPHDKPELTPGSHSGLRPIRHLSIGDRVGRYLVLSTLGAGGMGVVFAAYDPQLDRKVALKLLRSGLGVAGLDARSRLKREAQAIAQLSHPNVVGVYDVGTIDDAAGGDIYIAMEFIEGDTLTQWLKKWPRTWREIVDVFLQAGRGLYAAHSVGLLHRDFKPDNVLVGADGRVRVGDFGLARSVIDAEDQSALPAGTGPIGARQLDLTLTKTGTVLGTPRYMPPEQLTGPVIDLTSPPSGGGARRARVSAVDARSDQFSFCVALYESLYGVHPLPGSTAIAMLEHGERALPPPLPKSGKHVPAAIAKVVLRGLEREPNKRFPSMQALLSELVVVPARTPVRLIAAGLVALVLVGGTTAAVIARNDAPQLQPPTDAVEVLITQINEKEQERRQLLAKLRQLQHDDDARITQLTQRLGQADVEIQDLVQQVGVLKAHDHARPPVAPPPPPSQTVQAAATVQNAEGNLEGCFEEWADRNPNTDADLLVHFHVTPDGNPYSTTVTGLDGKVPEDNVLPSCASLAISRLRFPAGAEHLELEVAIGWSQGVMNLAPRVIGHRKASSTVDLQ